MDASGAGAGAIRNSAVPMSRIGLNDHKAGMKGLDKHKINQVSHIQLSIIITPQTIDSNANDNYSICNRAALKLQLNYEIMVAPEGPIFSSSVSSQIIVEASKGSKYYENEVKKEQTVTKKIETMVANLQRLTTAQKSASQQAMDREVDRLERGRVLGRVVVHVDMDAFYAAVEMRDNPALRDVPMAVGSQAMLVSVHNYTAGYFSIVDIFML